MKDLIEALTIFHKYIGDTYASMQCEHDVIIIVCPRDKVSEEDTKRLEELSFTWSSEYDNWTSTRFGSC